MFTNDLCPSRIEYLMNSTRREPQGQMTGSNGRVEQSILIEKTERSDTTNLQSSIVNIQFRLVRVGVLAFGAIFFRGFLWPDCRFR